MRRGTAGLFLLVVVLMAVTIRLIWAPHSLWFDEIASLKFSEQPYAKLWSDWMRRETNPPLYYSMLKAWRGMFGSSDTALRGLSTALGVAGVVAGAALAHSLQTRRAGRGDGPGAGRWTAVLIALSPAQMMFSQEVRGYGLAYIAALVALLGAVIVLAEADHSPRRRLGLLLYMSATTVALYAHTTMVLLLLIVNGYVAVWLVTARRGASRQIAIDWVAANLLILLAWAWWLQITVWQLGHASNVGWMTRPTLSIAAHWVFDSYVTEKPETVRLVAGLLMAGLAIRATWIHRRGPALLLSVVSIAAPALLFVLSFVTPIILPRTIFWASGPFLVMVGLGLASLRPPIAILAGGAIAFVLLAGCYLSARKATVEPWRQIVESIEHADPAAWVVAGDPGVAFALEHYCAPATCRLTIFTVQGTRETWSADMPRPRPHPTAYYGRLASRHRLFSATRYGRGDLARVAAPVARATNLASLVVLPEALALVEWSPLPPKIAQH